MREQQVEYRYRNESPSCTAAYLWPLVSGLLPQPCRAFEIGCGNGSFAEMLSSRGFSVTGVDTSESGVAIARSRVPGATFEVASVYEPLAERFGTFPVVISLEVIEHCPDAQGFMARFAELLEPGGMGIISTPYHGYLKNLAVVLSGRFDHHFDPLWQGGHLKFFSIPKLAQLFRATGFEVFEFHRVGRIPAVAKSVVAVLRKEKALWTV